jgi:RNA polymerase sigma factor (sigma-70 family)
VGSAHWGQATDVQLVAGACNARVAAERDAAFGAIAERYCRLVLDWCGWRLHDPGAAMDVGQMTFEAAFASFKQGKGPDDPRKLAQWLIGIAKNRRLEYLRQERRAGTAALPGNLSFDDLPDDAESRSGRAERSAHVQRLLKTVVATLEERDRLIYKLRFEQELAGRDVAKHLGVKEKTGSNEVTKVQHLVVDGFGALILAREGRPYCRDLARILDEAAFTGENYTSALRQRLVRHFSTCTTCDNCAICARKRRELVRPYVPGVIPALFGAEFGKRITAAINRASQPSISRGQPKRHMRRHALMRTLAGHQKELTTVAISPDGTWMATASDDGTVRTWAADGTPRAVLVRYPNTWKGTPIGVDVRSISPDGTWLATVNWFGEARIWGADGTLRATLNGQVGPVAIAPDGTWLVTGGNPGPAQIWAADGTPRTTLHCSGPTVTALAISPDGNWLAAVGTYHMAEIWSLDGTMRTFLTDSIDHAAAVAISPDGTWLAAVGKAGMGGIWNPDGTKRAVLTGHKTGYEDTVTAVAISPDGTWLVTASQDGTVRIWNPDGTKRAILTGNPDALAISPDGEWLVTGSPDGMVRIWNSDGTKRAVLTGHKGAVRALAISPDGTWLVTASQDGTART